MSQNHTTHPPLPFLPSAQTRSVPRTHRTAIRHPANAPPSRRGPDVRSSPGREHSSGTETPACSRPHSLGRRLRRIEHDSIDVDQRAPNELPHRFLNAFARRPQSPSKYLPPISVSPSQAAPPHRTQSFYTVVPPVPSMPTTINICLPARLTTSMLAPFTRHAIPHISRQDPSGNFSAPPACSAGERPSALRTLRQTSPSDMCSLCQCGWAKVGW
ncbi:hypothetical protein PSPO01_04739 [Paraphaeosphaeria sporulosa]